MGDPKKPRKHYEPPRKLWDTKRIKAEKELQEIYGLKNKKEIWKAKTFLRKKRKNARNLLALPLEQRLKKEKELIESLNKIGILGKTATLDDVLSLSVENLLERRLQTLVWRKGLARTVKQARQLIVHGHIKVGGQRNTNPSYIVPKNNEDTIEYYGKKIEIEPMRKPKREELKRKFSEALPPQEKENKEIEVTEEKINME